MAASIVVMVLGILLAATGYVLGILMVIPAGLFLLIAGTIGLIMVAIARSKPPANPTSAPIGHTRDGRPIYPVVGYTSGGAPVTADQAVGVRPYNPRTNNFAVVALVLALVFPLLAIPFGHIARRQIRQTGEQGAGLALAGLVIAYVSVVAGVIALIAVAVALTV
ncbi:DUF4190 domain-containing protein [Mycolicibacterium pulveris]|uniref:DUF4190 domain-containing protein n=1 Tax=Mycolicibacterium pulveris TaxID=36813 RepID=UPI003CE680E4